MKGKVSFYFDAPNTSKVRTRINPTPEFTQNLRAAIQEACVEVLNEQTYNLRCKLIKKFADMGEVVKDEKYTAQLNSALSSFFDVRCQMTPFREDDKDENEGGEELLTEEAPAEQPAPKAPKTPKTPAKKEDEGFDD